VFVILSTGLGVRLATIPPEVQYVYVSPPPSFRGEPPASAPGVFAEGTRHNESPSISGTGYLHLRDQVVRFGAESLPAAVPTSPSVSQPVEHLLGLPAGTLSDTQKSRWEHQLFQGGV
jgi:hypothetical protein